LGEQSSGGQESSGQADDEEHCDHADEDQDDYRPGLHDFYCRWPAWNPAEAALDRLGINRVRAGQALCLPPGPGEPSV